MGALQVQTKTSQGNGTGAVATTMDSNVVVGNTLIVQTITGGPGGILTTSITDNRGNTYVQFGTTRTTPGGASIQLWYAKITTGGSLVVTTHQGNPISSCLQHVQEVSGLNTTTPQDQVTSITGNSTTPSGGSITPTVNGAYLVSGFCDDGADSISIGGTPGWSLDESSTINSTGFRNGIESKVQTAIAAETGPWTIGSSEAWAAVIASFKPANTAPSVISSDVAAIGSSSVTGDGNVTSDGGAAISERGFVYGTSVNPTTGGSKLIVSGTTGIFSGIITGLVPNTTYHVRAYAINSVGTTYGADLTFTTLTGIVQTLPTPDTRISYTPKSKYSWLVYVNGQFFADLTGIADNRQFVITRNDSDQITFDCSVDKIISLCNTLKINMSDLFQSCISEIRVLRYGTVITAGELQPWDGNVGGDRRAKFIAKGWFELMKSRRVTTSYTSQSALFIAKDLLTQTLSRVYGSNGNYNGLVIGATPSTDNTTVYPLQQYDDKVIYDALKEMSNEPNGFDFEFTWDKRFNIYHPAVGVVRSDVIFSYPFGNVKDIIYSVDPTKIVNTIVGKGKGASGTDQPTVSLSDSITAQQYGIRDDRIDFSNISDQTQLTNLTQSHLNVYKNPLVINQVRYDGSGRINAPAVGELHVGDRVRINVSNLNLFKDISKYYVIDRISVALGQADEEDVTLNVADPNLAKNG